MGEGDGGRGVRDRGSGLRVVRSVGGGDAKAALRRFPLFAAAPLKNVGVHFSTFRKSERLSGLEEQTMLHLSLSLSATLAG